MDLQVGCRVQGLGSEGLGGVGSGIRGPRFSSFGGFGFRFRLKILGLKVKDLGLLGATGERVYLSKT